MIRFRELVASVEWGEPDAAFRLSRIGAGTDAPPGARLKTPDGQVLDLHEADWRALAAAVQRLFGSGDAADASKAQKAGLPNAGEPWTKELETRLVSLWDSGLTVTAIGRQMGRTPAAIASRLARLGIVESRDQAERRRETSARDGSGVHGEGQEPSP